ncbi:MAG TPA: hypothetical protein DCZ97_02775 [Syntrophus sp. (in: bacteria)]|nr:hypothetical protein [Syntrophus sp. (in: bacteria)]
MRVMKLLVMLMALACVPLLSHAAEVKLTSSTQYLWYQDLIAADKEKSLQDIAQYLRVNVTNVDKEGDINVYAYGRATKQVSTSQDLEGRLYYLYVDYRNAIKEHLDLRAGRTYVNAAAISGTVDGFHADVKNLGPVGVTLFGGRYVIFDEKREIGNGGDALAGMSVYLDTIKNTHVEVSYGRKYGDTDLMRENVGLDFSTTPFGTLNFYGRLKYDTMSESYNEMLFGAKVAPVKDLTLRGEYYESYPTFDAASIYSVFAVNQYKELSLSAQYQLATNYRVSLKYARETFDGDSHANVYEVGLLAKPIKNLTLNLTYENRDGYAGQLSGIRFYGEYKIAKASVLAGIDYDDFRRQLSREGSAKRYWAGVNYAITKIISAVVRVEDNINFTYDNSYQGYAAIQINY